MTTTWRQLLADTSTALADPREARWVVEHVAASSGSSRTGSSRTGSSSDRSSWASPLRVRLDEAAPLDVIHGVHQLVARRQAGEPLQHVLGEWGWRTLNVLVDARALVPRPETEVVTEYALAELDRVLALRPGTRLVAADLGTGSGVIALSLASERDFVDVIAVERSGSARELATANIARAQPSIAGRVRLLAGDWYQALPLDLKESLDLVVSNPPYLADHELADLDPVVRDHDPYEALVAGATGLESITRIVVGAPQWLAAGGALVVEIAPHQNGAVLDLAEATNAFETATVEPDLTGRPRALVARMPV